MACQYDEIDPSPQDYREHGGDEDVSSERCSPADPFRKPLDNEGDGDMLTPLQGNASCKQGGPYKAIPGKLLRPEERKQQNIPKYDLDEDIYGHGRDNDKDRDLGASIDYIAYSLHWALNGNGEAGVKAPPAHFTSSV